MAAATVDRAADRKRAWTAALQMIVVNGTDFGIHYSRMKGLLAQGLIEKSPSGFYRLTREGWDFLPADAQHRLLTVVRRDAGLD